jgi:hypothetical protein
MKHRILQFFRQGSYHFQKPPAAFLTAYLRPEEVKLFQRLRRSEAYHAYLVALGVAKEAESFAQAELVKMALFHDIGKIQYRIGLGGKSAAVVLKKLLGEHLQRMERFPFVASYLYHGEIGERILRDRGIVEEAPYLYSVVGCHHKPQNLPALNEEERKKAQAALALLKRHDDRY